MCRCEHALLLTLFVTHWALINQICYGSVQGLVRLLGPLIHSTLLRPASASWWFWFRDHCRDGTPRTSLLQFTIYCV